MKTEGLVQRIVRMLKEKELLKIGNRSYVNTFRYPLSRFDRKDLCVDGYHCSGFEGQEESAVMGLEVIPPSSLIFQHNGRFWDKKWFGHVTGGFADATVVIQAAINALTSGGKILIRGGTYNLSARLLITENHIEIEGIGKSTILKPTADINVFEIEAPVSRCRIANLMIEDTGEYQTSQGGIYLNHSGSNGQIHGLIIENVEMYYVYNGIYSAIKASDQINGLQSNTIRTVRINQYRGKGVTLYNYFDSVFDDILVSQKTVSASHGFQFDSSTASGSSFKSLKALGKGGLTDGQGFLLNNLSNVGFVLCHADAYKEGWVFIGTLNRTKLDSCSANSNVDQGFYVYHSSGLVTILNIGATLNGAYGLRNFGMGGNVGIIAGDISGNTNIGLSLASGDFAKGVNGFVTENSGNSTGTGAQQTIAHGLASTPNRVILWNIANGANPYQSAAADGTNIYVTAVNGLDWGWEAKIV